MNELQIIEYQNQRVLLTSQLAECYKTDSKVIHKNFERNKERFKEGKHYYLLNGIELSEFKTTRQFDGSLKRVNQLYLWTERGAFLHAKSLNTDKAWEVYDSLVEHYFKSREAKPSMLPTNYKEALLELVAQVEENEKLELENKELKPKAQFADAVSTSENSCLVGELAKIIKANGYDIGQKRLFEWLRENGYLMRKGEAYNQPTQKSMDLGLMKIKKGVRQNPDGSSITTVTTKITGKGQIYFVNKFMKLKERRNFIE
ncbi:MAG: phage antirepressor KilAC domain-containing protein [Beduini sp.]|uniref:phage antirepressor KilAC domain-containing protein n=1 Tax=Beduini sp. TaxID=1922300 RepID=UPI0039A1E46E